MAGASGALGREVVRALRSQGCWVRALTREPGSMHAEVDELFVGDLTNPVSIAGVCKGIGEVFTCAGITPVPGRGSKLTFRQVNDYGNRALLAEATGANVKRFGCVTPFGGMYMANIEYIRAHESFVAQLKRSGLDYLVVRSTMLFSALDPMMKSAEKGTVTVHGDGSGSVNPIHQADLAEVCAEALAGNEREIDVGGPIVYTRRELAELAFAALGKPPRIRHMPVWTRPILGHFLRFRPRQSRDVSHFIAESSLADLVAPAHGTRTLDDYFKGLASGQS